ncbi:TICRR protein, partial [Odontophorus gujanensis]|nr:TICRR protein [Odontophorus gujanensis]
LRLLNHLCCRFGLARLRWAYRFFDSLGGRGGASRGGGFRPPAPRAWARFEEELAERLEARGSSAVLPGPATRLALTHGGLKETLLDFQWDRPEIASPAKAPRGSRGPPSDGFANAVFLFSPCPRSCRELRQFVSGGGAAPAEPPALQDVAEKLLPRSVRELLAEQKITLYWVDTAESSELIESPDHDGYWTMLQLFHQIGGTILPSESLLQCPSRCRAGLADVFLGDSSSSVPQSVPWMMLLPSDSALNSLFSKPSVFHAVFPQQEGTLFLSMPEGKKESCAVILEPLTMSQRQLRCPLNIILKGSMVGWNWMQAVSFLTESWILRSSDAECTEQNQLLFRQLLRNLVMKDLHMIAEVSQTKSLCPCTAVLSPFSENAAVLTLFRTEKTAEVQRCSLEGAVVETSSQDHALHLPDVVHSVLSEIDMAMEDSLTKTPMSEWVRRELSSMGGWHPSVLEAWYSSSNACGASSDLMDSFRLLQVPCSNVKNDADQSVVELSGSLSELYQRKFREISAGAGNNKKRRGVPRTPVRQKMKTMSRSLQMLNVARLNVKAQKFQPDGMPTVSEKAPQKLSAKRLDEKLEEKEKALKTSIDFKTEEELRSHLSTSYQRVVAEDVLSSVSAQHMIMAIKRFLKIQNAKEKEVACVEKVRNHLLKTSKLLRQQHGSEKETKVRECRLQVFLRLELCLQCPSLQSNAEEMEQLLEEASIICGPGMTDMLRILCLAEDPGYLTKFLEEILDLYMNSIPKTLGDLYYSLGTQIPPKLASVLPSDFFSDDSMTVDSRSPGLPPSLSSVLTPTAVCPLSESDQLEDLRTRSA